MLVPSGNDAAYAVADYCGGLLATGKSTTEERIELFMDNLNEYLHKEGYKDTLLYDPSGFDMSALTTTKDLKVVTEHLLKMNGLEILYVKVPILQHYQMEAHKLGKTQMCF